VAVANAIGVARETHDKRVVESIREAAAGFADVTAENGYSS
jgi:hypothetical protein